MRFSANISEFNASSLSTSITWDGIKFNLEQKKKYKIQQQIGNFFYTCYMEVEESIKEKIILNNKDFSINDSELNITYNKNGYFDIVFKKDKLGGNRKNSISMFWNYNYRKKLDGILFIVQIRLKLQEPQKFSNEELMELQKERKKRINNRKKEKKLPPIKVFRGGACSPK